MNPGRGHNVERLGVDFENGVLEVEFPGGQVFRQPFEPTAPSEVVNRSDYWPRTRELFLDFGDGEPIAIDVGSPGVEAPRCPVVYLDQTHWVRVAQCMIAPDKLDESTRKGYVELIRLAERRQIMLPLSGAHIMETARKGGRQRRDLSSVILRLSRGWQMRSPFRVRRDEIFRDMAKWQGREEQPVDRASIFTLEPNVVFAEDLAPYSSSSMGELPEEAQEIIVRLTAVSSIAAAMMESGSEDSPEGRSLAHRWAKGHQDLAQFMHENSTPREHRKLNASAMLIGDLKDEVANAAQALELTPADLDSWLDRFASRKCDPMPYLDHLHDVIHQRLSNAEDQWVENDLVDVHFLSCAAGYADFVLGERKTSHYLLNAARRVDGGARVFASINDAVSVIDAA